MAKSAFEQIPQEKRRRVLTEAAQLFAERGFSATDVAELASRAGVSKGSLYNYFESKEDLYLHVCKDGLAQSRRAVYGGMDPEWDIYKKISLDVEKYTADHLKDQIHRGQAQGIVRRDLDPKLGAFFINSLYIIVVASVVSKHFQNRLKEYFEIKESLKGRPLEENLSGMIREIHRFLRP